MGPGRRLGVVLDAEGREFRVADPSEVQSLRLSRIVTRPGGSDSGTTTNPWFWEVISTRPLWQLLTGWLIP